MGISNALDHQSEMDVKQVFAYLAEEGKFPVEFELAGHVLPMLSVGVDPWVDRLTSRYLRNLSRTMAHSKLVIAPYGGGKTHFLLAVATRALEENFAVAFVQCG